METLECIIKIYLLTECHQFNVQRKKIHMPEKLTKSSGQWQKMEIVIIVNNHSGSSLSLVYKIYK